MDPAELLAVIVADGRVSVPIARLVDVTGEYSGAIRDAVRELRSRGIADLWESAPCGPAVVLTPHTVEQLDLTPDDTSTRYRSRKMRPAPMLNSARKNTSLESEVTPDGVPSVFHIMVDESALEPWR